MEDDLRADEVGALQARRRAVARAARFRAVAGDALDDVDGFAAVGRGGIDHLFVGGAGLRPGSSRGSASAPTLRAEARGEGGEEDERSAHQASSDLKKAMLAAPSASKEPLPSMERPP